MVITLPQLYVFLLILARVAGIFFTAPLLSSRTFPSSGKVALAIWVSAVLWFAVPAPSYFPDGSIIMSLIIF
ncbi:MAG: flagellar biosynthetic protein FliR, partial [Candidatus Margulisiibacteriota bacterium]